MPRRNANRVSTPPGCRVREPLAAIHTQAFDTPVSMTTRSPLVSIATTSLSWSSAPSSSALLKDLSLWLHRSHGNGLGLPKIYHWRVGHPMQTCRQGLHNIQAKAFAFIAFVKRASSALQVVKPHACSLVAWKSIATSGSAGTDDEAHLQFCSHCLIKPGTRGSL